MKRYLICICLIAAALLCTGCRKDNGADVSASSPEISVAKQPIVYRDDISDDDTSRKCTLIVKGKDITDGNFILLNYTSEYAALPLTAIAEELGAEVVWHSRYKATITYNEKNYMLNVPCCTLCAERESFNEIALPPGTHHGAFYMAYGYEFIIDSDSFRRFLKIMGAEIDIDYDSAIITIG